MERWLSALLRNLLYALAHKMSPSPDPVLNPKATSLNFTLLNGTTQNAKPSSHKARSRGQEDPARWTTTGSSFLLARAAM